MITKYKNQVLTRLNFSTGSHFKGKYTPSYKYVFTAIIIVIIALFLPKQPKFKYEFDKGKIWMDDDLTAPYNFAVLKTKAQILEDKKNVLKHVYTVYTLEKEVQKNELASFVDEFEIKWRSLKFTPENISLSKQEFLHNECKELGIKILNDLYNKGLISNNDPQKTAVKFTLQHDNIVETMDFQEVFTIDNALKFAKSKISGIPENTSTLLLDVIENHLKPNMIYDDRLSKLVQDEAVKNVSITKGMVQKGELIVSKNDLINDEVYQKLESYRDTYENQAKIAGSRFLLLVGQLIVVGFILSLLISFLQLFRKDIVSDNRQLSLLLIIVSINLISLSLAVRYNIPSVYYIPFCLVPIIIRILFDTRLALNLHLLVILVAGFFVPNSFEFCFYQITAGIVAIYSVRTFVKREQFLLSTLLIWASYFLSFVGISMIRDGSFQHIEWLKFIPFTVSVFLTLLAYPLIFAFEKLFGIVTDVALIELSNTNNKLLRELAFKAPGTFQHSMQVANLAEAAIYRIGGNALLVRTGALYHDIGKMENPQYFIENQLKGRNPHDNLSDEQSAKMIIKHVSKGIEIAKKNQLPSHIIDFIRTHHGTTRVDYFYQAHIKNAPEKTVDEYMFKYPGPIPFSKETAVLMLADSVEAAARSLKEPSAEGINDIVEKIIQYKLEQKQLVNSDITFKDIENIKLIFKTMLMSIYHIRIDYPEQL